MNFIIGFVLATVTAVLGLTAWELTMTLNPQHLGGTLIWGFLTFGPILFFVLGRTTRPVSEDYEHIVLETKGNWLPGVNEFSRKYHQ